MMSVFVGKKFSNQKPSGHAERMERYDGGSSYDSSLKSVDEERNKTELHGDPLKSRSVVILGC